MSSTLKKLLSIKSVGFIPGVCLLVNALTGPSMPFVSDNFTTAGWLFPSLFFFIFSIVAALSALFIVEAMQAIPGNSHFQGTVEFATLVNFFFDSKMHMAAQFALYWAIQSNAIQSIVLCAQTMDNILIDIAGTTCGIAMRFDQSPIMCVSDKGLSASPFGDQFMLGTFGLLIVFILCFPLSKIDLDSNINLQLLWAALSTFILGQWISAAFLFQTTPLYAANPPKLQVIGEGVEGIMGNIMLSLAITFVVPSWINLKKKEVNAQATLWWSSAISLFMYMCLGLIPALSFVPDEEAGGNLLVTLMAYGNPLLLTKITCYMFSIVMLLPSIPVSCIVSFDNLHQNEICSKRAATFLAFVVTWIMAIPLQTGPGLKMFQDWMSLLFVSTANFIVPVLIYLKCERFRAEYNQDRTILSKKQLKILRIIHSHSKSILQWIDYMDTGILIKSPKALDDDPPAFDTLAPSKPNTSPELASILRNAVDRDLESVGVSRVIDHKGTLQSEYLSPKESFEVGNILMGSVPDPVQEELMIEKIQEKRASANVPSIAIVPASPPEVLIEEEISEDTKKTKWGISSIFGRKQNVGDGEAIDTSTRDSYLNFRELELSDPGFIKRMTLPVEAEFVSNTFRALPLWFTKRMRTRYVAWITGFFVFVITICNIGMLIEKLSRGEFD